MYNSSLHLKGSPGLEKPSELLYTIQPRVLWNNEYPCLASKMKRYANFNNLSFFQYDRIIPKFFEPGLHSSIYEFCLALQGYQDSKNTAFTAEQIYDGCFSGPDYATLLKRIRTKSILRTLDGEPWVPNPVLEDIKPHYLHDVGEVFNYKYLINWIEPETNDLQEYSFQRPNWDYDEEELEEFAFHIKYELESIPIEKVKVIPAAEIILSSSVSSTKNGLPLSVEKQMNPDVNFMAGKLGDMRHYSLQKGPTESRDIVLLSPSESNLIKWVDNQVLEIVKHHKWSAHTTDPRTFSKRFRRLSKGDFFFCRDIEKEGLTKPHKLLEIILEELWDYSKLDCFKNHRIFSGISVDGRKLLRGHGLGMANALTTLMQIGIHSLNMSKLEKEFKTQIKNEAGFLNDDAAVSFYDRELRDRFIEVDFETCENLQVCSKDSKSFRSNFGFVLCEEFYHRNLPDLNKKDSCWRYIAMKPLNAVNIVHAKELAGSINPPGGYLDLYKDRYLEKWGYEFCPEEGDLPAIFGGWGSYHTGPASFDFYVADDTGIDYRLLYKLFSACKRSPIIPKWLKLKNLRRFYKKTADRVKYFYPLTDAIGFPSLSTKEREVVKYPSTLEDIIVESIQWRREPAAYREVWERLKKERYKAYKYAWCPFTYEDCWVYFKDNSPLKDHFIPKGLWQGYEELLESGSVYKNLYGTEFTNLNKVSVATNTMIGFIYPNKLAIERQPTRYIPPDIMASDKWLTKSFSGTFWGPEEPVEFCTGELSNRYYIEPSPMIVSAIRAGLIKEKVPVYNRWTHPLIREKELVYGRALDLSEEYILTQFEPMEKEMVKQVTARGIPLDNDTYPEFLEMVKDQLYKPLKQDMDGSEFCQPQPDIEPPLLNDKLDEETEGIIEEVYKTVIARFTWASTGVSFGHWDQNLGTVAISSLGYQDGYVLIPEVRAAIKERCSHAAYNDWIKSTGALGARFLEDDNSDDSMFGVDLDQL
jgi:hypothetical protein